MLYIKEIKNKFFLSFGTFLSFLLKRKTMNKNLLLARSIVSSVVSSLLYVGAISVMLIAAQIFSAVLILVAIITVIAPICMMKLELNRPLHVMWSSIIIATISVWPLVQIAHYQGVIVPSLSIIATIISYIAYEEM